MEDGASSAMQGWATALFAVAVLHTFMTRWILAWSHRVKEGGAAQRLLHLLGEVELVFGFWSAVLLAVWSARFGPRSAVIYVESINFSEAIFVFAIMCMSATRPILQLARDVMALCARLLPLPRPTSIFLSTLVLGPLLGSLITEPAAMTVTALLLKEAYFDQPTSLKFRYAMLGLLFVAVSVGGTLTHFAAPPVLMVATPWGWDTPFMFSTFGIRVALAIAVSVGATAYAFRADLARIATQESSGSEERASLWIVAVHVAFMIATIMNLHHSALVLGLLVFFFGWHGVTKRHQTELRVRESMLVGFFLAGLVVLGKMQGWWLKPLLQDLAAGPLFWGALSLTAITDNAAITYLGTLVPGITDTAKYALVAGAVTGGGLTIIANAPNPAGVGILRDSFGEDGISPLKLFIAAIPFTLIAAACLLI